MQTTHNLAGFPQVTQLLHLNSGEFDLCYSINNAITLILLIIFIQSTKRRFPALGLPRQRVIQKITRRSPSVFTFLKSVLGRIFSRIRLWVFLIVAMGKSNCR